MGRMYGFRGGFDALRVHWTHPGDAYSAIVGSPENRRPRTGARRAAEGLRNLSRRLRGQDVAEADGSVYLLWELRARKDGA